LDNIKYNHEEKMICELGRHKGVRLGESSVVSTRLHLLNIQNGAVIILMGKDIGKCFYKAEHAGLVVHIDTFHSWGKVDCYRIIEYLKSIAGDKIEILVETATGSDIINGDKLHPDTEDNGLRMYHVHTAVRISPAMYDIIIPITTVIEQCILEDSLKLKKVKSIKCERIQILSDIINPRRHNYPFMGEGMDKNEECRRVCGIAGHMDRKNNQIEDNSARIDRDAGELESIANMLKKNTCFRKEKLDGSQSVTYKRLMPFEKNDWLEEIAVCETAVSLIRKKYSEGPGYTIEDKDIMVYKRYVKDYRDTIFIIDNSQSMNGKGIQCVKDAVNRICRRLKGEVAVVTFSGHNAYLYFRFTNSKENIKKMIDNIAIEEVTPIAESLNIAYDYAVKSLKKEVNIILLTDGEPNVPFRSSCPLTDCVEVSRMIRRKGYNFCCISTAGEIPILYQITEAAGGRMYSISDYDSDKLYNIMKKEIKTEAS